MIDSKTVKKNILYNSIGNFVYLVCQWLLSIIVVKLSNYSDAGILSLAISSTSTLYAISSFSMRGYQSSDVTNQFTHSEYFYSRIYTSIISLIFCLIYININGYNNYVKTCIFAYMMFRIGEAFIDILHGEEQKLWRLDIAGISFFLRGVISTLIFTLCLLLFNNLLVAICLMSVSTFLII